MREKLVVILLYIVSVIPIAFITFSATFIAIGTKHKLELFIVFIVSSVVLGGLYKGVDYVQKDRD